MHISPLKQSESKKHGSPDDMLTQVPPAQPPKQQSALLMQLPPGLLQHPTVNPGFTITLQKVFPWPVSQHWLELVQGCCKPKQGVTQVPFWQTCPPEQQVALL